MVPNARVHVEQCPLPDAVQLREPPVCDGTVTQVLPLSEGAGGIGPDSPRGFSLRMNDRTGRRSRSAGGVRIETLGASSVPEVLCGQGLVGHYFRHGLDSKRVAVLDHLLDPWGLGLVHIEAEDRFDLAVQRGFGVVALNRQFVPCRSKVRVGKRPLIKPHQNALHQTIHPGLEVVGGNRSCRVREVPKRLRVHVLGRGGVQEDANAVGTDGEVRPKPPATDNRQIVRLSPIDARNTTVGGLPAEEREDATSSTSTIRPCDRRRECRHRASPSFPRPRHG